MNFSRTCPMQACQTMHGLWGMGKTTFTTSIVVVDVHNSGDVRSKPGIDPMKKLPGEGFKHPWPPLIKMDAAAKARVERMVGSGRISTQPPNRKHPERGVYAASPFASPQTNRFVLTNRTVKRPEGRAPGVKLRPVATDV